MNKKQLYKELRKYPLRKIYRAELNTRYECQKEFEKMIRELLIKADKKGCITQNCCGKCVLCFARELRKKLQKDI